MNDTNGLIHALVLTGDGAARELDWSGVESWQNEFLQPASSQTSGKISETLWIHLDYENEKSRRWITQSSGLDELTQQSLLAEETRPRCAVMEDGVLVNLRGVNSNPGQEPEDMVSIRIFTDGQRVISTRNRRLLSIQDVARLLEKGKGPKNIGELFEILASRLTERMSDVIAELDDAIDGIEEEILNNSSQANRSRLAALRREVIMLRRYLAPQREALSRLQSEQVSWLSAENRLAIRESSDRLARYIEDLDSCKDRAAIVYEELTGRLSEQMNARMYILSIVAALFLPLGFLTGLFGINVGGIPLAENPLGFIVISLLMLFIVGVQVVVFLIKKWF